MSIIQLPNSDFLPKSVLLLHVQNEKKTQQGVKLKTIRGMTRQNEYLEEPYKWNKIEERKVLKIVYEN